MYMFVVEEVNEVFEKFFGFFNDELWNKMQEFCICIVEYLAGIDKDIVEVWAEVNEEEELYCKEVFFGELDEFRKDCDKYFEEILKLILFEVFVVVKEIVC